jgi:lysophospholipase L1-like esterase
MIYCRMNWESLLCMGDSITRGARSYLGYPEIAASLLRSSTGTDWVSWNFAWNGYRAVDLLRAIDEHRSSIAQFSPSLCTIMVGTNDAKEGIPLADYALVMEQLTTKARLLAQNRNVLLLSVPRLAQGMSLPYNAGMNVHIDAYNGALRTIASQAKCTFLELACTSDDLSDGIHLNEAGARSFAVQLCRHVLQARGLNG